MQRSSPRCCPATLIEKVRPFAEEKLAERAKREAEKTATITRKKPLKLVEGSKK